MSCLRKMDLVVNSLPGATARVGERAGDGLRRRSRGLAGVGVASGFLLAALSAGVFAFATAAMGQAQAGAATQGSASSAANPSPNTSGNSSVKTSAAATQAVASSASEPAVQKSADAAAQNEPKMEDQSAPAAESLGEAARRARAQKTQAAKPKVYNDDTVTKLSGHGVSVVGGGNSGSGGASYSGSGNTDAGGGASGAAGSQESYWRGRANEIRKQMAACDQRISEIQDEIAKHGAVSVDPMSGAQAGVIFVEDRNAQIKQVEKQKDELQNQLDALTEEGRKAGADSGWFR